MAQAQRFWRRLGTFDEIDADGDGERRPEHRAPPPCRRQLLKATATARGGTDSVAALPAWRQASSRGTRWRRRSLASWASRRRPSWSTTSSAPSTSTVAPSHTSAPPTARPAALAG
eukprot:4743922-Prymnesium_polylepis.2